MPRRFFVFVVIACLLFAGARSNPSPAVAQSADTGSLTVTTVYNLLLDDFVHSLDPDTLLGAAWQGALAASKLAAADQPSLPALPQDRAGALQTFLSAYQALAARSSADAVSLSGGAAAGMVDSVNEQHTYYLTPSQYALQIQSSGGGSGQVGVGISLRPVDPPYNAPPVLVASVVPGGPADQAGVKPGDTLAAVDGQTIDSGVSSAKLRSLLAGPEGSNVVLHVQRPGADQMDITVQRGRFAAPIFSSRILPNGVGVIRLTSFPSSTVKGPDGLPIDGELDAALQSFEQAGVQDWVIDLRGNGGGSVTTDDHLLGRFVADGVIARSFDDRDHLSEEIPDGHLFSVQRPLAVLIDGNSASSSEVFSSAIREYGRGILVGTRSAGALAGNESFPLPNGGGLAVTVTEVTSGKLGQVIDQVGIEPDVVSSRLPTASELAAGFDPQLDDAVNALQGASVSPEMAVPSPGALSAADIRAMLGGYRLAASEVPSAPLVEHPTFIGDRVLTHVNEFVTGARDPFALRATTLARGWEGEYDESFAEVPEGPGIDVSIDLYANAQGAHDAIATNDFADGLIATPAPIHLGDDTAAYRGQWLLNGSVTLMWRHGATVFTINYHTQPGLESFDPVLTVASALESHFHAMGGQ